MLTRLLGEAPPLPSSALCLPASYRRCSSTACGQPWQDCVPCARPSSFGEPDSAHCHPVSGLCHCVSVHRSVTKATGVRVGLVLWLVMLTSCGMFSASAGQDTRQPHLVEGVNPSLVPTPAAFLPSSFCMYCTMIAFGAWMSNSPAVRPPCAPTNHCPPCMPVTTLPHPHPHR